MDSFEIRQVDPEADSQSISSIYNHYIELTSITFELETLTCDQMRRRIEKISTKFPYFVITRQPGKVIGYCYANTFRERAAYNSTVELSVFVDRNFTGLQLGTKLYEVLLEELQCRGFKVAVAAITLPNLKSIKFHEKFGLLSVGTFTNVGKKFGVWHDVHFLEFQLGSGGNSSETKETKKV